MFLSKVRKKLPQYCTHTQAEYYWVPARSRPLLRNQEFRGEAIDRARFGGSVASSYFQERERGPIAGTSAEAGSGQFRETLVLLAALFLGGVWQIQQHTQRIRTRHSAWPHLFRLSGRRARRQSPIRKFGLLSCCMAVSPPP